MQAVEGSKVEGWKAGALERLNVGTLEGWKRGRVEGWKAGKLKKRLNVGTLERSYRRVKGRGTGEKLFSLHG